MIRRCGGLMWTLAARKRLGRKRIETNEPPRLDGKPDGARSVRVMEWPRRSGAGGRRRVLAMTKRLVYIYIGNAPGRFLELQRRFFTVSVLKFLDLALPSLRNLPWSRGEKSLQASRHRIQALRAPRFDENPLEFAAPLPFENVPERLIKLSVWRFPSFLKFLDLALPSLCNLPWSRGGKKPSGIAA